MNPPGSLDDIVKRLHKHDCVLCVSSRIDTGHSLRSVIEELLREIEGVDWDAANRLLATTPLTAASYARRRLGPAFLPALVRATTVAEVPEAIQLFAELPFRAIITTSMGDVLERIIAPNPVCTPHNLYFHGHERHVLALLGRVHAPESLIITAQDVATSLADPEHRAVLQEVYGGASLVLVGFSAADAEFRLILEHVVTAAGTDNTEHFAVLAEVSDIEREELDEVYGVRVVLDDSPLKLARTLCAAAGNAPRITTVASAADMDERIARCLARLDSDSEAAAVELEQLESALRRAGDYEHLIDLYVGRVGVEEDPEERAELFIEMARMLEREMNDAERALRARLASYENSPRPGAWADLERLAAATGHWNELLETLSKKLDVLDVDDRVDALLRMARLYDDELGHRDYALHALDMAVELDPDREQVQVMRLDLLRRCERWDELIEALEQRALAADSALVKCDRYVALGDLYESRLGDQAQALVYYGRAVEADPWSPDARLAYEALLRRRGDFAELMRSLEQRLYQAPMDEQVAIRKELAALCDSTLGDQTRAIRYYEDLRADAPADVEVMRALARLYEQTGCIKELLGVLAAELGVVEDNAQRVNLCLQMASLWHKVGSEAQVQESLEWVLAYGGRSQEIFATLVEMYRAQGDWRAAIDVYCRHARSAADTERAQLYCEVARIYETELDDPGCAIDFYVKATDAVAEHHEALSALVRLYEKRESFDDMLDVLARQAEHAAAEDKVALYHCAGEIALARLDDTDSAEQFFGRALAISAGHVPCLRAMAAICKKRNELDHAAEILDQAVSLTPGRERVALLMELAEIREAQDQRVQAAECYRELLDHDPTHLEATSRLCALLWADGHFDELLPLLQMLVDKEPDHANHVERLLRLGRAAAATGHGERAHDAFARALELAPSSADVLSAYAEFLCEQGEWARARALWQKMARYHEASLPSADYAALHYQLARCALELGESDAAREHQAKALGAEPAHTPSLVLSLRFDDVPAETEIATKEILVDAARDPGEKVSLLVEISDIFASKSGDLDKALEALHRALAIKPNDHLILHKCLDVLMARQEWRESVAILVKLIDSEEVATVRARYRYTKAMLLVDKLSKSEAAKEELTRALDEDPGLVRASEALEEMLHDSEDWQGLAEHYAAVIQRLGAKGDDGNNTERARLWSGLGRVSSERLGDVDGALCAYEVAVDLDSDNMDYYQALAPLYAKAGPEYMDKALSAYQRLLRAHKREPDMYETLEALYLRAGEQAKAVFCASARAFVEKSEAAHRPRISTELPLTLSGATLDTAMWAQIRHPDQDRRLSALFALVSPVLSAMQARPLAQLGLAETARVPAEGQSRLARMVAYVARTFALAVPAVYWSHEPGPAVRIVHCATPRGAAPALVIDRGLMNHDSEREVIFYLARCMAALRADLMIQHLVPNPRQLAQIIDAAMALSTKADGHAETAGAAVTHTATTLAGFLTPVALEQVVALGRELRARGQSNREASQEAAAAWLRAADHTASRAALAITGDLTTCVRLLAAEPARSAHATPEERIVELVWSSATEELFLVRNYLGRWLASPGPQESAAKPAQPTAS